MVGKIREILDLFKSLSDYLEHSDLSIRRNVAEFDPRTAAKRGAASKYCASNAT